MESLQKKEAEKKRKNDMKKKNATGRKQVASSFKKPRLSRPDLIGKKRQQHFPSPRVLAELTDGSIDAASQASLAATNGSSSHPKGIKRAANQIVHDRPAKKQARSSSVLSSLEEERGSVASSDQHVKTQKKMPSQSTTRLSSPIIADSSESMEITETRDSADTASPVEPMDDGAARPSSASSSVVLVNGDGSGNSNTDTSGSSSPSTSDAATKGKQRTDNIVQEGDGSCEIVYDGPYQVTLADLVINLEDDEANNPKTIAELASIAAEHNAAELSKQKSAKKTSSKTETTRPADVSRQEAKDATAKPTRHCHDKIVPDEEWIIPCDANFPSTRAVSPTREIRESVAVEANPPREDAEDESSGREGIHAQQQSSGKKKKEATGKKAVLSEEVERMSIKRILQENCAKLNIVGPNFITMKCDAKNYSCRNYTFRCNRFLIEHCYDHLIREGKPMTCVICCDFSTSVRVDFRDHMDTHYYGADNRWNDAPRTTRSLPEAVAPRRRVERRKKETEENLEIAYAGPKTSVSNPSANRINNFRINGVLHNYHGDFVIGKSIAEDTADLDSSASSSRQNIIKETARKPSKQITEKPSGQAKETSPNASQQRSDLSLRKNVTVWEREAQHGRNSEEKLVSDDPFAYNEVDPVEPSGFAGHDGSISERSPVSLPRERRATKATPSRGEGENASSGQRQPMQQSTQPTDPFAYTDDDEHDRFAGHDFSIARRSPVALPRERKATKAAPSRGDGDNASRGQQRARQQLTGHVVPLDYSADDDSDEERLSHRDGKNSKSRTVPSTRTRRATITKKDVSTRAAPQAVSTKRPERAAKQQATTAIQASLANTQASTAVASNYVSKLPQKLQKIRNRNYCTVFRRGGEKLMKKAEKYRIDNGMHYPDKEYRMNLEDEPKERDMHFYERVFIEESTIEDQEKLGKGLDNLEDSKILFVVGCTEYKGVWNEYEKAMHVKIAVMHEGDRLPYVYDYRTARCRFTSRAIEWFVWREEVISKTRAEMITEFGEEEFNKRYPKVFLPDSIELGYTDHPDVMRAARIAARERTINKTLKAVGLPPIVVTGWDDGTHDEKISNFIFTNHITLSRKIERIRRKIANGQIVPKHPMGVKCSQQRLPDGTLKCTR